MTFAGLRLADEAFALDAGDGVGDFDGAGFEVDLVPEDGEGFADAGAGAEREGDQVGKVGLYGAFVSCQALAEQGDLLAGEGTGWILGRGFDGVDLADGG